jgi:hypothetical protein
MYELVFLSVKYKNKILLYEHQSYSSNFYRHERQFDSNMQYRENREYPLTGTRALIDAGVRVPYILYIAKVHYIPA